MEAAFPGAASRGWAKGGGPSGRGDSGRAVQRIGGVRGQREKEGGTSLSG